MEASNKISEKRKEFWEFKDKNLEKIQEAVADLANSGIPTARDGQPPPATSAHCRFALEGPPERPPRPQQLYGTTCGSRSSNSR